MRSDYQIYFVELRQYLFEIGAVCLEECELRSTFLLSGGWKLYFDCERYYGPSWLISIIAPDTNQSYAVWVLMRVFEGLTGDTYGSPTIKNQVAFVDAEGKRLFGDTAFYSKEYYKYNLNI